MAHDSFFGINEIMLLLPNDLSNKRILDVGFGCGTVIYKIISTSSRPWANFTGIPTVVGIDKDPQSIDFAKTHMPFYNEVYLRDVLDIPYPNAITNKPIDIIICSEVLEHLLYKDKALELIKYLSGLAPLVIFTCPNDDQRNKIYKQDWHNHNIVWYEKDFTRLGFKTKLLSPYPKNVELGLRIVKKVLTGKSLARTIIAWKISN